MYRSSRPATRFGTPSGSVATYCDDCNLGQPVSEAESLPRVPRDVRGLPTELVGLTILALFLRSFRLTAESLWIDELFMVQMATEHSLQELVFEVPLVEPHPPLYNAFMWLWVEFTAPTAFWMRSTSVLFSVLTVPVLYYLALRLFDREVAALTTLLFAISPFQIWHAQDARMYALLVLATVTSWYLLLVLKERWTRHIVFAYLLTGAILGYTHVYGLLILLAQVFLVIWWVWRSPESTALSIPRLIGSSLTLGILLSPWLLTLLRRIFVPDPEFEDPADWLVPPQTTELVETARLHALGATRIRAPYDQLPEAPALLTLVFLVPLALVIGGWFMEAVREHEPALGLVSLWIVIPVFLAVAISHLVQPMYELRYTIVAAPAFLMLLALGISMIRSMPRRVLLIVLIVTTMAWPLAAFYDQPQKDQWIKAADITATHADDETRLLIAPGWTTPAFNYYYEERPGDQVEIWAGTPQSGYDDAVADRDHVILVASYLDDRQAVVDRTETAMDRPPDRNYTLVNIDIHVWE